MFPWTFAFRFSACICYAVLCLVYGACLVCLALFHTCLAVSVATMSSSGKRRMRRRSVVWDKFEDLSSFGGQRAICRRCGASLSGEGTYGTSHLRRHLERCMANKPPEVQHTRLITRSSSSRPRSPPPLTRCARLHASLLTSLSRAPSPACGPSSPPSPRRPASDLRYPSLNLKSPILLSDDR